MLGLPTSAALNPGSYRTLWFFRIMAHEHRERQRSRGCRVAVCRTRPRPWPRKVIFERLATATATLELGRVGRRRQSVVNSWVLGGLFASLQSTSRNGSMRCMAHYFYCTVTAESRKLHVVVRSPDQSFNMEVSRIWSPFIFRNWYNIPVKSDPFFSTFPGRNYLSQFLKSLSDDASCTKKSRSSKQPSLFFFQ
jgi:hypothetical protein